MPVDEYKKMLGDKTITEDVEALYRHFIDVVMPRNRWSWADVAIHLKERMTHQRYRLDRKTATVFRLLLDRVQANMNIKELLKESMK